MKLPAFTPAEKKMLGEWIPSLSEQIPLVPWAEHLGNDLVAIRGALTDTSHHGKFSDTHGWSACRTQQRVASIPLNVIEAVRAVVPDLFENDTKFYAWLDGPGREYDLRRKRA